MAGQRPGPYDRPMMPGPRGGFLTAGPGRGATLMDTMRGGGGYGGGRQGKVGVGHLLFDQPSSENLQAFT